MDVTSSVDISKYPIFREEFLFKKFFTGEKRWMFKKFLWMKLDFFSVRIDLKTVTRCGIVFSKKMEEKVVFFLNFCFIDRRQIMLSEHLSNKKMISQCHSLPIEGILTELNSQDSSSLLSSPSFYNFFFNFK